MNLFDLLISKIAPYDCLACGAEGRLLCADCASGLPAVPERCYSCQTPSPGWRTCPSCQPDSLLREVRTATVYDGHAKDLIWKLKLGGARAAGRIMAERLVPLTGLSDAIIVPVPTATRRVRQRGYDQAKLLASELSRLTGLANHDCLARQGQSHQHGLSRHQRLGRLAGSFRVVKPQLVEGRNVILVDDVVTTGATLEAAAEALTACGAAWIAATAFAVA